MKRLSRLFAMSIAAAFFAEAASAAVDLRRSDAQDLEDVQVGERDRQTRIALVCAGSCTVEKRGGGSFFLHGVTAEMTLDLTARSRNVAGFRMMPDAEGSVLDVDARRLLEYANVKPCEIAERAATCIDLFFADAEARPAKIATPTLAARPPLRESAPDRLSRYASLGPPERLEPPQGARLASVQPAQQIAAADIEKPVMRDEKPSPAAPATAPQKRLSYADQVEALLGKKLSPGFCASAKATLQSDPWALAAMTNVGLCEASAGKVEEGEAILARLLEYTPDNYEAHVGRALIALAAGEKSVARLYFQNALYAPPPIQESTRIVEAMRAL